MVETATPQTKTFSRRVCLEDFLDDEDDKNTSHTNNKYNKKYSQKEDTIIIAKNQQEFGQRKRIKP